MRTGGAIGFIFSQEPEQGGYCARIRLIAEIEARSHFDLYPNAATNPAELARTEVDC